MKTWLLLFALALAFALLTPHPADARGDKKALMLTVFGSSTEASVTFDELVPLVQKQFPDRTVVVPYTSGVIRNKLNADRKDPAQKILSPEEMLTRLKSESYTDIAVVSTLVFAGVEHDKLNATVEEFKRANPAIRVAYISPILGDETNLQPVVGTLAKHMTSGANVVVAHGTHDGHEVEKTYEELAALVAKTYPNARLGSIEGVPDMKDVLEWVKTDASKDVRFIVFMFVAGDHAENDIASNENDSLFSTVRKMGKKPSVAWVETSGGKRIASLGLDPDYRKLLLAHYGRAIPE